MTREVNEFPALVVVSRIEELIDKFMDDKLARRDEIGLACSMIGPQLLGWAAAEACCDNKDWTKELWALGERVGTAVRTAYEAEVKAWCLAHHVDYPPIEPKRLSIDELNEAIKVAGQ